ncbi:hypothetical protein JQN58_17860 [Aneurinibacillus sp. BA2021]|nr:hypothetical protein [Aneurinibacillus sp. BA2021]
MKIDWFWLLIFIVMMTVIGFVVFDNTGASLVFGIGTGGIFGGIFGWMFSGKKSKKE